MVRCHSLNPLANPSARPRHSVTEHLLHQGTGLLILVLYYSKGVFGMVPLRPVPVWISYRTYRSGSVMVIPAVCTGGMHRYVPYRTHLDTYFAAGRAHRHVLIPPRPDGHSKKKKTLKPAYSEGPVFLFFCLATAVLHLVGAVGGGARTIQTISNHADLCFQKECVLASTDAPLPL